MLDAMDVQIFSFAIPAIIVAFAITNADAGLIGTCKRRLPGSNLPAEKIQSSYARRDIAYFGPWRNGAASDTVTWIAAARRTCAG